MMNGYSSYAWIAWYLCIWPPLYIQVIFPHLTLQYALHSCMQDCRKPAMCEMYNHVYIAFKTG